MDSRPQNVLVELNDNRFVNSRFVKRLLRQGQGRMEGEDPDEADLLARKDHQ